MTPYEKLKNNVDNAKDAITNLICTFEYYIPSAPLIIDLDKTSENLEELQNYVNALRPDNETIPV